MPRARGRHVHRLVLVVLLLSSSARALADDSDPESPALAIGLSAGVTAGGVAMLAAATASGPRSALEDFAFPGVIAVVVGPHLGHFYAQDVRMTPAIDLEVFGLVSMAGGAGVGLLECDDAKPGCGLRDAPAAYALLIGGAAAMATGIVWNIASSGQAVRRYNRAHHLAFAPAPVRGGVGFVLSGRFQ
ncbi:MAG TPA: hypothetical protein VMJ10_00010 [Kofleriaceae bacterium]|nr:hypothetical protein [Kofleriaceae bacterium]